MTQGTTLGNVPARIIGWALPYWTRGEAGRQTPADLFRVLYLGWLAAFVLKVLGSSWDVSWHFRWLRDDLAPPHLLNTVGTVIAVGLAIVHWYTGYGVDRTASRLIVWGTGVFLVAIPLDLINHRVNGLDITAWSPSHALLFIGTALMIAGAIRGWWTGSAGRPEISPLRRSLVLGGLFAFFLENAHFPEQHQEYGVLELASWDRGHPYAEPSLLHFAADQMGRAVDRAMIVKFSLPIPDYVYPVYAGILGMAILVFARLMVGRRLTATTITAVYVGYRCLVWPLLVGTGFPPSAVPFFFLLAGVCVDAAFLLRQPYVRAVGGAVLVTAAVYGGLAVQDRLLEAPPYARDSWPVAAAGLVVAWLAVEWFVRRHGLAASDSGQATGTAASVAPLAVLSGTAQASEAVEQQAPADLPAAVDVAVAAPEPTA
ncbi:hypothetical protein [Microbispora sp. ATCC PTA-5024]|uniref:hypothetical protein n=1 Tax=Microbispora sp. ATCC PTA-5024 TaxID=316330 RepID=UPI0003DDEA58|nr:hypothetical protein [Microbispora sp. ATCC PTA-5024]ETK32297.1 hypothetical protein MPTA5024_30355 [Microbispora sp. ATCC PTA-5024]